MEVERKGGRRPGGAARRAPRLPTHPALHDARRTLPSNLALCVHPDFVYVRARDPASGKVYIVAESRLAALPGAVAKKASKKGGAAKGKGAAAGGKDGESAAAPTDADGKTGEAAAAPTAAGGDLLFEVLGTVTGAGLAGQTYEPLFPYFAHLKAAPGSTKGAFRVLADTYVTSDSGTGVVHCAPAFGEDDARVCAAAGVCDAAAGDELPCPVDANGRFTAAVPEHAGVFVKDADKAIVAAVKAAGRLVDAASIVHSYPYCWRSDTPLIYKAVPSWFVRVEAIKDRLLAANAKARKME